MGSRAVIQTAASPIIGLSVVYFTVPLTGNFCYDTFFNGRLHRLLSTEVQRFCLKVEVSHLTVYPVQDRTGCRHLDNSSFSVFDAASSLCYSRQFGLVLDDVVHWST